MIDWNDIKKIVHFGILIHVLSKKQKCLLWLLRFFDELFDVLFDATIWRRTKLQLMFTCFVDHIVTKFKDNLCHKFVRLKKLLLSNSIFSSYPGVYRQLVGALMLAQLDLRRNLCFGQLEMANLPNNQRVLTPWKLCSPNQRAIPAMLHNCRSQAVKIANNQTNHNC